MRERRVRRRTRSRTGAQPQRQARLAHKPAQHQPLPCAGTPFTQKGPEPEGPDPYWFVIRRELAVDVRSLFSESSLSMLARYPAKDCR